MRVTSINYISPNFNARKPEIKKADDIQRIARREFPTLSSTYVDMFYCCTKKPNKDLYKQYKAEKFENIINEKITDSRNRADRNERIFGLSIPYTNVLNYVKRDKAGNCAECSASVIAALAANGIYDSQMTNIGFSIEFINKNTKETEYKATEPIDHSMVLTALNKTNPKKKDIIVIDSWLGFTDSISGAKNRYKKVFTDKFMESEIKYHRSLFRINQYEKSQKFINYDDYDIRTRIYFYKAPDKYNTEDLKDLGTFCRIKYPMLQVK